MTLHKSRIALVTALLALAAVSVVDSASADGNDGRIALKILEDPTADNADVYAFTGGP